MVRLTDFDISLGAPAGPHLLASLNGGPEKVAILDLDLDLAGVTLAVDGRPDRAYASTTQPWPGAGGLRAAPTPTASSRPNAW